MKPRGALGLASPRVRRGLVLSWSALFLLSLLLQYATFVLAPAALAVHNEGLFELDKNATQQSTHDWDQVFADAKNGTATSGSDHVIFATDKAIATKPQVLRAFLAGWFETIGFMRKDKAATLAIAKTVMGADEPTSGRIYDEMMPMFNDDGHFKPKALAVLSRSFVDMKTLPEEPDMRKLINESFLPKR